MSPLLFVEVFFSIYIYSDNLAVCDYGKTIEKPLGRVWITDFLNIFQQIWVGYGYMDSVDGSEI